jgi:hypothetical protein
VDNFIELHRYLTLVILQVHNFRGAKTIGILIFHRALEDNYYIACFWSLYAWHTAKYQHARPRRKARSVIKTNREYAAAMTLSMLCLPMRSHLRAAASIRSSSDFFALRNEGAYRASSQMKTAVRSAKHTLAEAKVHRRTGSNIVGLKNNCAHPPAASKGV